MWCVLRNIDVALVVLYYVVVVVVIVCKQEESQSIGPLTKFDYYYSYFLLEMVNLHVPCPYMWGKWEKNGRFDYYYSLSLSLEFVYYTIFQLL